MAIWLLARAAGAPLPRRLVYVVDRRTVVDQATWFAEQLRKRLQEDETLASIRCALGLDEKRSLPISTLRGQHADNREWMADPSSPAIIVGTVYMIGSRLLFEGYGVSRRMRPYVAGLLGCDTLVMLDEAHLSGPFERLLRAIEKGQNIPEEQDHSTGLFAGALSRPATPPPFRMLPLSATLGSDASANVPDNPVEKAPFRLNQRDWENEIVRERLEACKALTVWELAEEKPNLADALIEHAWQLMKEVRATAIIPPGIVIYCNRRTDAKTVAQSLRKKASEFNEQIKKEGRAETKLDVILFVGARRGYERQKADQDLRKQGLIGDDEIARIAPVFLVATSAGEVGVDLDADHMVCDLVAWERMVQRLGRVNRRGKGKAKIQIVDQGPPNGKKVTEEEVKRHHVARELLDALPRDECGHAKAGPGVLASLGETLNLRSKIAEAITPMPLYPALSRPLVDAWSMTSLHEHTGRPDVAPWLRGWVDNEPQTTVIWRRFLPVRAESDDNITRHGEGIERAFFEAARPQLSECLETNTSQVVRWLKKCAKKKLKGSDDIDAKDGRPPITPETPVAFRLDRANRPVGTLSLREIADRDSKRLQQDLTGCYLVIDARFGGLSEGLLDDKANGEVATIEDNWGNGEGSSQQSSWPLKVEVFGEEAAKQEGWRNVWSAPYRVSAEGEATSWLVVCSRQDEGENEDASAVTKKAQLLEEHQRWAGEEAERIAGELGLNDKDQAMLIAAARHHDDGKAASRWQRAFGAKSDDVYAKTTKAPNQQSLNGFRHELKSALDVEMNGLNGIDREDQRFDLALHMIAAHHGHARPAII